jgi:diaminohydroxyphosphoribosylaminopyrimidine deaminase/5-amino-6-(5-phosphoribosylamino)uracil reductase
VLPAKSRIFSDESETIVYRENTDWSFVLNDLGRRNIHSVLVEGGAKLLDAIIASGVYDEVHVEIAVGMQVGRGVKAPNYTFSTSPQIVDGHCVYIDKRR